MNMDEPNNNGRQSDGRFGPGNKLGGRTPGSRHRVTLAVEALLEGEAEGLTRTAIEAALGGDMVALRLCLERIVPARKDAPVEFSLPDMKTAEDAVKAAGAVLEAVGAGELTPREGSTVAGLVEGFRRALETNELERRVAALEKGGPR